MSAECTGMHQNASVVSKATEYEWIPSVLHPITTKKPLLTFCWFMHVFLVKRYYSWNVKIMHTKVLKLPPFHLWPLFHSITWYRRKRCLIKFTVIVFPPIGIDVLSRRKQQITLLVWSAHDTSGWRTNTSSYGVSPPTLYCSIMVPLWSPFHASSTVKEHCAKVEAHTVA